MSAPSHAFVPELLWTDAGWRRDCALVVDTLGAVHSLGSVPAGVAATRWPGRALMPGLVNAHSHAFQRAIRGRTEHRGDGGDDDFWSWRDQMYRAAIAMSPEALRAISRLAFLEMLLAGITSVGEFHYLHRDPGGAPYADPNELARQVIWAAGDVGLRIALLRVAYARGGPQQPLQAAQRRFAEGSPEEYLRHCQLLLEQTRGQATVTVGVAPHSVRAVPRGWLAPLRDFARGHALPVHMHLGEQPKEIEGCLAEHGLRPAELCHAEGLLDERFTAVHAIHLSEEEIALLGRAHSTVCACPTTERNLGDGVVPAPELLAAGVSLALGSDGQSQIDLLEDARELEYHLRLSRLRRAVLGPRGGDRASLARRLFEAATLGGARSLCLPVGALRPGTPADFFTVDLADPSLAGAREDDLLAGVVFGSSRRAVREVAVGGDLKIRDGRHPGQATAVAELTEAMEALWS